MSEPICAESGCTAAVVGVRPTQQDLVLQEGETIFTIPAGDVDEGVCAEHLEVSHG